MKSIILLLFFTQAQAYEPQYFIPDENIDQNFRNIAAELKNVNSDSVTASSITSNGDIYAVKYYGDGSSLTGIIGSTGSVTGPYVFRAGDTMTGELSIRNIAISTGDYNIVNIGTIAYRNDNNFHEAVDFVTLSANSDTTLQNEEDGSFHIKTITNGSISEDFTIKGSSVGINKTSPAYKFDVGGGMRVANYPTVFEGTSTFTNDTRIYGTATFDGTIVANGINAGAVNGTSFGNSLTTYSGIGTGLTGIAQTGSYNNWTGVNDFTNQTTFNYKTYIGDIDMSQISTPTIKGYNSDDASFKQILVYPGFRIRELYDYAYGLNLGTGSLSAVYYDSPNTRTTNLWFDSKGLRLSSGIVTGIGYEYPPVGSGNINPGTIIVGEDGRIPNISTHTFASLDGSLITGITHNDTSKVPLDGTGTMTGTLHLTATDVNQSTGNIVMDGQYPHSIQFNNQRTGHATEFQGEVQFLGNGTGKHRIITYGDSHATYPAEMQIGADATAVRTNVRITGNPNMNADLFISSWTSVGINTAHPNAAYVLDANGNTKSLTYTATPGAGGQAFVAVGRADDGWAWAPLVYSSAGVAGYIGGMSYTPVDGVRLFTNTGLTLATTWSPSGSATFAYDVYVSGNVGIGTAAPPEKLTVQDGVVLSSTTAGFGTIKGYGSSGGCLMFRDTDNAGWTKCTFDGGVISCTTDADGVCD